MKIIDTHVHFWDLSKFSLPWLDAPAFESIARTMSLDNYHSASSGWDIDRIVYMEVDIAPDQQAAEVESALELTQASQGQVAAAVIGGHPGTDGFRAHVSRWLAHRCVKGVRQVLQVPERKIGHCLSSEFVDDVRWLGEQGLNFDLCMRSAELEDGAKLIQSCPNTRFILDHCGNPNVSRPNQEAWRRAIATIAVLPNVDCKLSGLIESAPPEVWTTEDLAPFVSHVVETFGPDRLTFGSNWPVCNLNGNFALWMDALTEILQKLNSEDREKVFRNNAMRIYSIDA